MARGRFPQGPTASRPVGKLHTFGRVCLWGGQKYFSLPSLAAQLRAFLVLLPCTHKWLQRKRSLQAWYRLRLWGLLVRFSRFVSSCCLQQLTNRRGQGRGDCSFQSQTPLAAAPYGLACSTFVSVDKMSERRQVFPLQLLWCDRLCTPQRAVDAYKYIYQYRETWLNCCC